MVKMRSFSILISVLVFQMSEGCRVNWVDTSRPFFIDSFRSWREHSEEFAYPEISDQAKREAAEKAKKERNEAKRKMVLFAAHNQERVDQQLPREIVNYLGTFVVSLSDHTQGSGNE